MRGELKPPVILFGNTRSGTSVLQNVITADPHYTPWYEPRNLWQFADPGRLHDEFDASDATDRVKKYIRRSFYKYQRDHGNRVIVEKTPVNILRIPYVREIFPEATILYVVRTPFSFISSVELKWQRTVTSKGLFWRFQSTPKTQVHHYVAKYLRQQFDKRVLGRKYLSIWGPRYKGIHEDLANEAMMTVIARQWAMGSAKAEQDLAAFPDGAVLRLRYEDFVNDPLQDMERVCRHLERPMGTEIVEAAKKIVKSDRQTKWTRFDPADLAKIVPEIETEMHRHGYGVPDEISRHAV